ncbi:MAG TPA: hypothetical protein VER33_06380 [Polyangiaceae bacterium]|nr:hypothetical protein [Polyangiaceae bacterium]
MPVCKVAPVAITALSTDRRYAFVTHGGDGRISAIDTAAREVSVRLDCGGYLVSVQSGVNPVDTITR